MNGHPNRRRYTLTTYNPGASPVPVSLMLYNNNNNNNKIVIGTGMSLCVPVSLMRECGANRDKGRSGTRGVPVISGGDLRRIRPIGT
jgi:hypothetical protein